MALESPFVVEKGIIDMLASTVKLTFQGYCKASETNCRCDTKQFSNTFDYSVKYDY